MNQWIKSASSYSYSACSSHHTPPRLGGPGVIVQIDDILFCHKAKYNRGRRSSKEQWLVGLTETSAKPAITYMQTVDKRDVDTLLPIIQRVVQPGTIIHSDQWRAYGIL